MVRGKLDAFNSRNVGSTSVTQKAIDYCDRAWKSFNSRNVGSTSVTVNDRTHIATLTLFFQFPKCGIYICDARELAKVPVFVKILSIPEMWDLHL